MTQTTTTHTQQPIIRYAEAEGRPWAAAIVAHGEGYRLTVGDLDDFEIFAETEAELVEDWENCLHSHLAAYRKTGKPIPPWPAPTPSPEPPETTGISLIATERQRQIESEGWTPEHDDEHERGELAAAAACYALPKELREEQHVHDPAPGARGPLAIVPRAWPCEWSHWWWKPSPRNRVRELVKAGALIAAEIDRLLRASSVSPGTGPTPDRAPIFCECMRCGGNVLLDMTLFPAFPSRDFLDRLCKCQPAATPSSTGTADDIAQFVEYWINEAAEQWPGSKLADRLPECIAFIRARRSPGANKRDENWNVDAELVKAGAPAGDTEAPSSDAVEELLRRADDVGNGHALAPVVHGLAAAVRSLRQERDALMVCKCGSNAGPRLCFACDPLTERAAAAALRNLREKADGLYKHVKHETSHEEGWNDAIETVLSLIDSTLTALEVEPIDASLRSAAPEGTRTEDKAIRVWRFDEAPAELQALSNHGGDEDWLAYIPAALADSYIRWLEEPAFGCCSVSEHPQPDGSVVRIAAHA